MPDDLENTLTRTIAAAADAAPGTDPDLLRTVTARAHRRMTVRAATAVATVVTLSVGGVALARTDPLGPENGIATGPAAGTATREPDARPLSDLGDAVRRLPARLPDGREYILDAILDDARVVVQVTSGWEKTDQILVWDVPAGTTRVAAQIVNPSGAGFYGVGDVTVAEGRIAWSALDVDRNRTDLWSVPVGGGTPVRAARVTAVNGNGLAIDGDELVWSSASDNPAKPSTGPSVWRVPVTGGTPRAVPGTTGYFLYAWPWAGTPEGTNEGPIGDTPDERPFVQYRQALNLVTGERRGFVAKDSVGSFACGAQWCAGVAGSGSDSRPVVVRRDGSDRRTLAADFAAQSVFGGQVPLLDRFVFLGSVRNDRITSTMYDLKTRRLYRLAEWDKPATGDVSSVSGRARDGYVSWVDDPDHPTTRILVDLSAIR